jgi:hypothetical protein
MRYRLVTKYVSVMTQYYFMVYITVQQKCNQVAKLKIMCNNLLYIIQNYPVNMECIMGN